MEVPKTRYSVNKSSTAAEYVALSDCVSKIRLILNLLKDFKLKVDQPVKIYDDNSGAIAIAKFGNLTKNSKYIEVHYYFVNECYERKIIDIVKVESERNLADISTKALGRTKLEFILLIYEHVAPCYVILSCVLVQKQ